MIRPDAGGGDVFLRAGDARVDDLPRIADGAEVAFRSVDVEGGKMAAKDVRIRMRADG